MSRLGIAAAAVLALLPLCACTSTTITPMEMKAPARSYSAIAVGDITAADTLWNTQTEYLRRALIKKMTESNAFDEVLDPAPSPLPDKAVLLTGKITDVDKGDKALRAIIGFGAGEATMTGTFKIEDPGGAVLASFEAEKGYAGGAGIGGFDLVDMDELATKLGEEAAEAVARWTRGEKLEPQPKRAPQPMAH